MQRRITTPGPLHDENGRLVEVGWATELIKMYDRSRISVGRLRLKEWDYYAVVNDRFALALTVDHNGYMTMDSISFLNFEERSQVTASKISLPCIAKRDLPPSSEKGDIRVHGKGYELIFENDGKSRLLHGYMDNFSGRDKISFDLLLTEAPRESMVIVTPYKDHPEAFFIPRPSITIRKSTVCGFSARLSIREINTAAPRTIPLLCWTGAAASGPTTTPGTGVPRLVFMKVFPLGSISATVLGIPQPPVRMCCSITEKFTS